jgi:hypothetical protein
LGEMEVLDGAWKRDKLSGGGGSSGGHGGGDGGRGERPDLYEEVRRRERDTVVAGQRDQWARRPPSTKQSLSQTHRHSHLRDDDLPRRPNPPPPAQARAARRESPSADPAPAPRKRTAEEMAMVADKKRKLMSKYG